MKQDGTNNQTGLTLVELVVIVAIVGLLFGIAITSLAATAGGLKAGTDQLVSVTSLARAFAMSKTTPHRVVPVDETSIRIEYGGPCGDAGATWTPVAASETGLRHGVRLVSTSWDVCFNTRGWTTDVHDVRLVRGDSHQDVSILLGGSVQVGQVNRQP